MELESTVNEARVAEGGWLSTIAGDVLVIKNEEGEMTLQSYRRRMNVVGGRGYTTVLFSSTVKEVALRQNQEFKKLYS